MTMHFEPTQDQLERMARFVHEAYLEDHRGADGDPDHPANKPWDVLDDGLKAQNRQQVRRSIARIEAAGYEIVPKTRAGGRIRLELDSDLIEELAKDEHDDWCEQKEAMGYIWGEQRDDVGPPKTHPDLVPWDELDEEVKEKDRQPIRRILAMLDAAELVAVLREGLGDETGES